MKVCQRCRKSRKRVLRCDSCPKEWCWDCALHYGATFGPSHPSSGWGALTEGDPKYLIFRCRPCADKPENFGPFKFRPV